MHSTIICCIVFLIIYVIGRTTEREKERVIFHPLFHSPSWNNRPNLLWSPVDVGAEGRIMLFSQVQHQGDELEVKQVGFKPSPVLDIHVTGRGLIHSCAMQCLQYIIMCVLVLVSYGVTGIFWSLILVWILYCEFLPILCILF